MATQTSTQRSAAAKRAAATRKRNAAKQSAAGTQLGAVATSAQRVLDPTVGAIATAGDAVKQSAPTYTNSALSRAGSTKSSGVAAGRSSAAGGM